MPAVLFVFKIIFRIAAGSLLLFSSGYNGVYVVHQLVPHQVFVRLHFWKSMFSNTKSTEI